MTVAFTITQLPIQLAKNIQFEMLHDTSHNLISNFELGSLLSEKMYQKQLKAAVWVRNRQ